MDKVSVIVPVYNVEPYLNKCINSIINQTYSNLEIILVDDGSTDKSGVISDELKRTDNRIKVIHKKNGGLSSARNTGIEFATGEYFAFIDSDDWIEPNMIEVLYNNCIEYSADISACSHNKIREDGSIIKRHHTNLVSQYSSSVALSRMFRANDISWGAWNKLYKRKLFETIRYPEGRIMEDKATTYKLFHLADKIVFADVPLYNYLLRQGSIIRSEFNEKSFDSITAQEELITFLESEYLDIVPISKAHYSKVVVMMLCDMVSSGYDNHEKIELCMDKVKAYAKYGFKVKLLDWRFKLVLIMILIMEKYYGRRIYNKRSFKKMCVIITKKVKSG